MTIPILPGKFDFLANLGRAGGAAAQSARGQKRFNAAQAKDTVDRLVALRSAGLIDPSEFNSPKVRGLFAAAGLAHPTGEPTPQERLRQLKGEFIQESQKPPVAIDIPSLNISTQVPGGRVFSDAERRLIGQPTTSQLNQEAVAGQVAKKRSKVLATGTPAQQAEVTGLTPPLTLQAKNEAVQNAFLTSLSGTAVSAAITTIGGDVSGIIGDEKSVKALVDASMTIAKEDARSRQFVLDEQLTRPLIESAVRASILDAEDREIRRTQAISQFGSRNDPLTRARVFQLQADKWKNLINSLPKVDTTTQALARVYESTLNAAIAQAGAGTPEEIARVTQDVNNRLDVSLTLPAHEIVADRQAKVDLYTQKANDALAASKAVLESQGIQSGLSGGIPQPSAAPAPGLGPGPAEPAAIPGIGEENILRAAQALMNIANAQEIVDARVKAGKLSQQDADAIVRKMNEIKQDINNTGVSITPSGG